MLKYQREEYKRYLIGCCGRLNEALDLGSRKKFCVFVDLEKAFDRVEKVKLWEILLRLNVIGPLMQAVKSLYKDQSQSACESEPACRHAIGSYTRLRHVSLVFHVVFG